MWSESCLHSRQGQSYFTLLYDLERSTVEAISEGHDTEAADKSFSQLSPTQIESIEAIAMDRRASYVKSAKANIPMVEEKIVHDRFHVELPTKGFCLPGLPY